MPYHKGLRKVEEANFKVNFLFFTSLSATEAHVLGVIFIGLYGTDNRDKVSHCQRFHSNLA